MTVIYTDKGNCEALDHLMPKGKTPGDVTCFAYVLDGRVFYLSGATV